MSRVERGGRWRSIKQRLKLKGMASCCGVGAPWGVMASSNMSIREEEDDVVGVNVGQIETEEDNLVDPDCVNVDQITTTTSPGGMNLATALAAERHFRAAQEWETIEPVGGNLSPIDPTADTSSRVSLMRLLHEMDGNDLERESEKEGGISMCCVCMGRRKGAAFIPCGHTFCRVCSREIWLNRGSCPLCNRSILEILDIF
ncbi:hypothetical protein GIB67_032767 [Kingdonia uniflora]|uniref:RING-type domain-containing protein n=1 Tax=Kingdonia uniflora TaxID=39325 RepID=A0A7J7MWK3_9MAGN|nr:hypothetical protein GIB67_032767 [Kingdonia uniflora]